MEGCVMHNLLLLVSLALLSSTDPAQGHSDFMCGTALSKNFCLPDNYSKFELPNAEGVNKIYVSIDIDEVLRINDKDYSITFATYFNVEWYETRLTVEKEFYALHNNTGEAALIPMNLEFVKDLWLPNIFIYNIKSYKVIDVLSKLAGLWIDTNKLVLYSQATHISFICPMSFDKFPLDQQRCKFRVGSYSYDTTKMVFINKNYGYGPKKSNSIALDYDISIEPLNEEDKVLDYGSLGKFSLAGFEMVLTRHVTTYIITYYIPSGLCVIMSWISFLIPMDFIPGRMVLLVTILLVLVNILNTVTTNTPKVKGLTAIEVWMLACILFIFGALIEYAAILFKKQKHQHKISCPCSCTGGISLDLCGTESKETSIQANLKIVCKENLECEVEEMSPANQLNQAVTMQQLAEDYLRIDKFFLISFPILFFIFNIIYWLAYYIL